MTPVDVVLEKLAHVTPNGGKGWMARCPAHDDRANSLSVGEGDEGCVVLHCFAGCTVEHILAALGLTLKDLFARKDGRGEGGSNISPRNRATLQPPTGCTLAGYAKAKKLPVAFLQGLGLSDMSYLGAPAVRIPYLDQSKTEVAVRFRLALTKCEQEDNRFRWKSGTKPGLYGLWCLECAKAAGYAVQVEGESDCHTLWLHDVPALGIPGASTWREERDAHYLDGIPTIYTVVEPDRGGETVRKWLAASRIRNRVRLLDLAEHKDPSGLYLSGPEQFRERWQAALAAAVPWGEHEAPEPAPLARDQG